MKIYSSTTQKKQGINIITKPTWQRQNLISNPILDQRVIISCSCEILVPKIELTNYSQVDFDVPGRRLFEIHSAVVNAAVAVSYAVQR